MTRLAYTEEGDPGAPPLVLSHSLGTQVAMWEPNVEALSAEHRVVRYDHRGEGSSDSPAGPYEIADLGRDAIELLDDLGIERASWAGVSLGGMVGMWLAANAPERIDRLVLICTAAYLGPPSMWAERAAKVREAGTVAVVAEPVAEKWLTPEFVAEHPEDLERLRAMLAESPPDGYVECCGAIERMDLRPQLPRITAPTLVIAGAEDGAAPLDRAREIADGIPGARLEVLSPAAHVASWERADDVNQLILDHLEAR